MGHVNAVQGEGAAIFIGATDIWFQIGLDLFRVSRRRSVRATPRSTSCCKSNAGGQDVFELEASLELEVWTLLHVVMRCALDPREVLRETELVTAGRAGISGGQQRR